jgi:predicted aminopeptidase
MTATGRSAELDAWLERQRAGAEFVRLLAETRRSLAQFYATETDPVKLAEGKKERLRNLEERYAVMVHARWGGRNRFAGWFDPPPNNADLALVGTYSGGWCAFAALWQQSGEDFQRFQDLARERARSDPAARSRWLATPCRENPGGSR